MRFTKEKDMMDSYYFNKTKTKTKFLWWPITIGGETRWLETATIKYRVFYTHDLFSVKSYHWGPLDFVDNV